MSNPILLPIGLAALASFFYASSDGFIRSVIRDTTTTTAVFTSLTVNVLTLWVLSFLTTEVHFNLWDYRYFVVCGILGPVFGRWFKVRSLDRLGISISTPIISSYPIVTVLAAIMFMGERLSVIEAMAVLFAIAGGVVTVSAKEEDEKGVFQRRFLHLPVLSSLGFGSSHVLRKTGISLIPSPLLAGAVTTTTAWVVILPMLLFNLKRFGLQANRHQLKMLSFAGFCTSTAIPLVYLAYRMGDVVVVAPFANISPIFALCIARIFFHKEEFLSFRVVAGTSLIVAGVILLNLFR